MTPTPLLFKLYLPFTDSLVQLPLFFWVHEAPIQFIFKPYTEKSCSYFLGLVFSWFLPTAFRAFVKVTEFKILQRNIKHILISWTHAVSNYHGVIKLGRKNIHITWQREHFLKEEHETKYTNKPQAYSNCQHLWRAIPTGFALGTGNHVTPSLPGPCRTWKCRSLHAMYTEPTEGQRGLELDM